MAFVSCTKLDTELAKKQGKLKKCDGTDLPDGTNVPTCAEVDAAVAAKQGQLKNCAGVDHPAGATVPTCAEVETAITAVEDAITAEATAREDADEALQAAIDTKQGQLNGCDGNPLPAGTEVATCDDLPVAATDTVAGISALNLGTALPGDATNTTDALTAAGVTAILNSTTANPLKAAVLAQVPDTAKTVRGLVNLTDLQQMGDGRKVFDAGVHVGSGNPAHAGRATVTAIGPNAGANNTGDYQTATGNSAGQNNTGDYQTATGYVAGYNNTGDNQTATGYVAGLNNTGYIQTATGYAAGYNNTGDYQTATGYSAGQNNTGYVQTATGFKAGYNNTGDVQTATGASAGYNNTGDFQTATGASAGYNNTGLNNSFYGYESGTQSGALLGTVTMTPSSSTAGTVSPALPASVVGKSLPVNISGYDWRVLTFTSTTAYTMVDGPASGAWTASVYEGLAFNNVTALGYDSEPTASNQVMLGNGAVTEVRTAGTYFGAGFTTVSDATLKEKVETIDPAKALQFRNGLQWKHYEVFAETQSEVKVEKTFDREETVVNEDGSTETKTIAVTVSEPTGAYKVTRVSQGYKYGLIAQDVQALAETVGAFGDVVVKIGEYFTLDERGFPVKDADGKAIVNDRLGLDYDAINVIVMAAEQFDSTVTMRQARLALLQAGLLADVETAVAGADKATQIEWEFSNAVDPSHKLVDTLAGALGITKEQVNSLIALAKTL